MAAASRGGSGAPVGGAVQMVKLKTGMRILKHFPNQSESDYYDYYEGVLLWFDPTVGTLHTSVASDDRLWAFTTTTSRTGGPRCE